MATMMTSERKLGNRTGSNAGGRGVSQALRQKIDLLLAENYAYMDSTSFRHKNIEKELFDFEQEPELPLTSWYQPTRDDVLDSSTSAPQLMKSAEERLMFLRFNFCKRKLSRMKTAIAKDGLTRESALEFLQWHRKFE